MTKPIRYIVYGVIGIAVLGVGSYFARKWYLNYLMNKLDKEGFGNTTDGKGGQNGTKGSGKTSFPRATYVSMSNKILKAIDGCGIDEDAIYGVLRRLKTRDDWRQLNKIFGYRTWNDCILKALYSNPNLKQSGDLMYAFKKKLSSSQYMKAGNILKAKNII